MDAISLAVLVDEQLSKAREASSGRSAHTVYGGHQHALRQTLIALAAGRALDDHESPGEATLQVLRGRLALAGDGGTATEVSEGDYLIIPPERHSLAAAEDSAILLTVAVTPQRA